MRGITDKGVIVNVDTQPIDNSIWHHNLEKIVLIEDGSYVKKSWRIIGYHNESFPRQQPLTAVAEQIFDEYPTDEQLIYFMGSNGLNSCDFCGVEELFSVDWERED